MALKFSLSSVAPERARCDVLAVGMYADAPGGASRASGGAGAPGGASRASGGAGAKMTPSAQALDKLLDGSLAREAADGDFKGRLGSSWIVTAGDGVAAKAVLLVGLGKRDELTLDGLRRVGATVASKLKSRRSVAVTIVDAVPDSIEAGDAVGALAEGIALGNYSFQRYKSKGEAPALSSVAILGASGARAQRALDTAVAAAGATAWARDLVNEPAAGKSPSDMVAAATRLLRAKKVKVDAWSGPELSRRKLTGTITVGQG